MGRLVVPMGDRAFGIEMEFKRTVSQSALAEAVKVAVPNGAVRIAGYEHTPNCNRDWVVKYDGSCGWEVVSPRSEGLVGLDDAVRVLDSCRSVGARVNGRCGVHIHYEVVDLSETGVGSLCGWWVCMEGFLGFALPRRRRGNPYCMMLSEVCGFRSGQQYGCRDIFNMVRGNRRRSLNVEPYCQGNGRVEVRVLEGMVKGSDEELEKVIVGDVPCSCLYAKDVIKGRWPEAEGVIAKNAYWAGNYAHDVINGRWPEVEPVIVKSAEYAYKYARDVIKGRWPEAERAIARDAGWAGHYARDILKGRWPEADHVIGSNPFYSYHYAKNVLCGPFSAGELVLSVRGDLAYLYAKYVLNGRFRAGEPEIWARRDSERGLYELEILNPEPPSSTTPDYSP